MMLNGKAKVDFEKWYIPYIRKQRTDYDMFSDKSVLITFDNQIESQKYGVYVDFFDSVGFKFKREFSENIDKTTTYYSTIYFNSDTDGYLTAKSIGELNSIEVEQANEIYNSK